MTLAAVAAGACAVVALPAPVAFAQDGPRIGVAMKTQLQRRWGFDAREMERRAEELGATLLFQWANDDPTLQASQAENLLSQGIDALILVPVDGQAAGRIVDAAHESGVPVVSYDIGIGTAVPDFSVIRHNKDVGFIQARAAVEFAPSGVFAIMKGDPANDVAQLVAEAYGEVLAEAPDITIVFEQFIGGWSPEAALTNAENVLSAQEDNVDVFLVTNDGMAAGVSRAIISRGLEGQVFLSGLDADPANLQLIRDGIQTLSVWTDLRAQGSAAVTAAAALAAGETPDLAYEMIDSGAGDVRTHLVEVMAIDSSNLCEFITDVAPDGWITVDEVFDDPAACD